MNARQIAFYLATKPSSPFRVTKQQLVVPNVSWGMGWNFESDLIVVSKSGYVTEIEIKVSKSDFIRDSEKLKWRNNRKRVEVIKNFYYAVPESLYEAIRGEQRQPGSGIVVIGPRNIVRIVDECSPNALAKKMDTSSLLKLSRLGSMRVWKFYKG